MYGISVWTKRALAEGARRPERFTSADILAMLDESNPAHVKAATAVRALEVKLCRYSGEDFDTLSRAYHVATA